MTLKNTFNVVLLAIPSTVETQQLIVFPPCQIKKNHLIGSNKCFYCNVFSYGDALGGADSVSTKETESEDSWTLILISYSNDSESNNPPPDSPSLCTAISHQSCTYTVIPCQFCPCTVISHQPCPCTVISSQPCPCKLALY